MQQSADWEAEKQLNEKKAALYLCTHPIAQTLQVCLIFLRDFFSGFARINSAVEELKENTMNTALSKHVSKQDTSAKTFFSPQHAWEKLLQNFKIICCHCTSFLRHFHWYNWNFCHLLQLPYNKFWLQPWETCKTGLDVGSKCSTTNDRAYTYCDLAECIFGSQCKLNTESAVSTQWTITTHHKKQLKGPCLYWEAE